MLTSPTESIAPRAGDHSDAVAETIGLTRTFGRRRALGGVDLVLHAGECLAVFGPNGAGKTTLLRVLAGLIAPTSGVVRVGGVALPGGSAARAMVGIISHHSMLYSALTPRENVELAARLYGVSDAELAAERALGRMDILGRADGPVRALSRGLQQRVAIARAVVHSPRLLLLDEPYTGLDESGTAALTETLRELMRGGATLVLATHNVGEGLAVATHVAILRRGQFVRYEPNAALDPEMYATAYRELVNPPMSGAA